MKDFIGLTIDRYQIVEQLGQGGMAIVYKALDTRLDRDVAIKIIRRSAFPPEVLERVLKRFDREAKVLARLTHPNIVGVIDYGEYEESPYLVMPYIQGGSLKEQLGQPVPWREAVQLILPLAQALEYAHQHQIIHRDLKPSNILITESGQPMLSDFGIAKILELEETQTLTGTGVGIGTPEYMAPEQGMGKEIDGRADVYSFGIVLYELITGQKPYTADTPMGVVFKHLTDPLPNPREKIPELPSAVEQLLLKALSKKPEERCDMHLFNKRLSDALIHPESNTAENSNGAIDNHNLDTTYDTLQPLAGSSDKPVVKQTQTTTSYSSSKKSTSPTTPKSKRTGIIFGGSLIVCTIALWFIIGKPFQSKEIMQNSQSDLAVAVETTQTATPFPTKTSLPTFTPTATIQPTPIGGGTGQIVYLSGSNVNTINIDDLENSEEIATISESAINYNDFRIEILDGERITIIDESDNISYCSGLCDDYNGNLLTTYTKGQKLCSPALGALNDYLSRPNCYSYSLYCAYCTNGYSSIYYPGGNTDTNHADYYPVWSPNGDAFVYESFRSPNYEIILHNMDTHKEIQLTNSFGKDAYHPAWSADGEKIAFILGKRESKETSQICYVTVDDQKVSCITNTMTNKDYPAWSPDGKSIVYSEYLNGDYELIVIDIDGENTIQLTDNNVDDYLGLWLR